MHNAIPILLLAVLLLLPAIVSAEENGLAMECYKNGILRIGSTANDKSVSAPDKRELIDYDSLIKTEGTDDKIRRAGSSVTEKTCGAFKIKISGGYLNPNPQGRLGFGSFPVVSITYGKTSIVENYNIQSCEKNDEGYYEDCPEKWVNGIALLPPDALPSGASDPRAKLYVSFDRSYSEAKYVPLSPTVTP